MGRVLGLFVIVLATTKLEAQEEVTPPSSNVRDCLTELPVCGENKAGRLKTFRNKCQAEESRYMVLYPGRCTWRNGFCSFRQSPVCGVNKAGELRTFGNMCKLRKEDYREVAKGKCKCVNTCPVSVDSICGENNFGKLQTFANECVLRMANCNAETKQLKYRVVQRGVCTEDLLCPKHCNKLWMPVCGEDQHGSTRTFGNVCLMRRHNCKENKNFVVKVPTVCDNSCPYSSKICRTPN